MDFQTIQAENGGRPLANDDLLVLQMQSAALGLPALLASIGPCVVSGCKVFQTGNVWNVAAGMVWDGLNLLPFPGASGVAFPAMFQPGQPQVVDERPYQTGGTKTTIKSQVMELVPLVAGSSNLVIDANGAISFWQRMQEKTREIGTIEYVSDLSGYDDSGLGMGAKRGWALCNGKNGTPDLRQRSLAGYDPENAEYSVGYQGGSNYKTLSIWNLPAFKTAKYGGRITYKGGESGGYAVQDASEQTIGGGGAFDNRMNYLAAVARQWIGL